MQNQFCCLIVWLWHQITLSCFYCYKFGISCFLIFFIVFFFQKLRYHQVERTFLKVVFTFFLALHLHQYGFNQCVWLNWMIPCTYFNTNPWLSVCFKVLRCTTYPFLSWKLPVIFSTRFIFIYSGKNGKSL